MDDQFKTRKHKPNHEIKVKEVEDEEKIEVKHEEPEEEFNLDKDDEFKTPDAISSIDTHSSAEPLLDRKELTKMRIKNKKIDLSILKEKKVYIPLIIVLILIAGIGTYFGLKSSPKNKTITGINTHAVVKTTAASKLTGLQVNPLVNKLPITAVMIENSFAARPQSGLSSAGVVFEAVAEGGVTRFMALFQNNDSTSLGPIRSARPYYVSWAMGFDASYVHVGGSPDALSDLNSWGTKNLDQFYNGDYFQRVNFRDAPHNVYCYLREESGVAMTDSNTNTQLSPKVVIGIVVPASQGELDASGAYYTDYQYTGTGNAYIYQDGTVTKGTWTKSSNKDQIKFTTLSGQVISLNAGQTWITAVKDDSSVSSS
ncbi:DUF3048 domain-containing protein [bacterium]|nr:DUF3048 domain-containing protein [bacterium]